MKRLFPILILCCAGPHAGTLFLGAFFFALKSMYDLRSRPALTMGAGSTVKDDIDPELRRLAAVRLTELEGDGSTQAMVELYNQTSEPEVKTMLIDTFARISEIDPLSRIASSDPSEENRQRALRRIKFLKEHSESADVRNWDVSSLTDQLKQVSAEPLPPLPPPPAPPPPPPPTSAAPATRDLPPPPPPPRKPDAR
jgi:hypothetical protein